MRLFDRALRVLEVVFKAWVTVMPLIGILGLTLAMFDAFSGQWGDR